MNSAINSFLLVYAGLFPIVDPIGGAPIFLGLTRRVSEEKRRALAAQVAINGFFLLLGSLFLGSYVLEFFGITLPVVRIAGGLVVASFAWKLLHENVELQDHSDAGAAASENRPIDAFYPLTMPLTVGPGSISVALALGANPEDSVRSLLTTAAAHALGILIVALLVYLCYRYADAILRRFGATGAAVLTRLSAFIMLAIGVQIAWNGIRALLATLPHAA